MWKSIMCSPRTAEPALLILLDVLGSWPEHSTCTSDGDKTGVFGLAATVVMWKILQVPCVPHMVTVYFPRLFVHLLSQVFFSTLDVPEEVDAFWKGCQEEYGLATSPNRFAVRTLKSLLCRMQHEDVVVAMERSCGWDTLLCADTHHCAVGLLAREMCCVSMPLCSRIARYLLRLLSTQEPRWQLPALAFLVEVSLMASAAWLSCLPALCPPVAAAAWDGARALCCCLGPALCGSGLLPAGSPVTALCLSGPPQVPGLE
ncbi:maestro heat-like repeat-containing protein family member 7 [Geothlypis trichas]